MRARAQLEASPPTAYGAQRMRPIPRKTLLGALLVATPAAVDAAIISRSTPLVSITGWGSHPRRVHAAMRRRCGSSLMMLDNYFTSLSYDTSGFQLSTQHAGERDVMEAEIKVRAAACTAVLTPRVSEEAPRAWVRN